MWLLESSAYPSLIKTISKIIKQKNKDYYIRISNLSNEIKKLDKLPVGGDTGYISLFTDLLIPIGIGIVTYIIIEISRKIFTKIRDNLKKDKLKRIALKESEKFKKDIFKYKKIKHSLKDPDMFHILLSMPQAKRNQIIDDIALQHAINVSENIKRLFDENQKK